MKQRLNGLELDKSTIRLPKSVHLLLNLIQLDIAVLIPPAPFISLRDLPSFWCLIDNIKSSQERMGWTARRLL